MPLPSFILFGAAKSGTTSLHNYLGQHPDIFVTEPKEPNFFAFIGRRPQFRGPADERLKWSGRPASRQRLRAATYTFAITSWSAYYKLYDGSESAQQRGEASVFYMFSERAVRGIHEFVPNAKLIAILRNPVDRAFSKFAQFRRDGCEPFSRFSEALAAEPGRIARGWSPTYFYRARGCYYTQLSRYYRRFSRQQIHVILYDDFVADPQAALAGATDFLELRRFEPDVSHRFMDSSRRIETRSAISQHLLSEPNLLKSTFNFLVPDRQKRQAVRRRLLRLAGQRATPVDKPDFDPSIRADLTAYFKDENERLQDLLDRNLRSWLP